MIGSEKTWRSLGVAASGLALMGSLGVTAMAQSAPAAPVTGDAAAFAAGAVAGPTGEETYQNLCAACHMADAGGATGAGAYPALAANNRLMAGAYPLYVVMKGKNGMPPMGDMLTDAQVADVVNYVRTHFGNDYPSPVLPEQVAAMR